MIQISMLPERIRRIVPNPNTSADSPGIGVAYSGQRYILKVAHPLHPYLPASEWICHALAQALEMAVPHWTVCQLPSGSLCFGSRFEGSITALQYLPVGVPTTDNPEVLAATYVLDLFTANQDRHPGNWLETEAAGVRLLRPIDYSRALLWNWPLPLPPFNANTNSGQFYQLAFATKAIQKGEGLQTLGLLKAMPAEAWRTIVASVPPEWIPQPLLAEIMQWWGSAPWRTRINWIEAQL